MKQISLRGGVLLPAALVAVLSLAAGCGRGAKKPAAPVQAVAAASPVQVAPARTGTVLRRVPVTGSLKALESVDLSPKQGGRLVEVSVREGDPVAAGQVVARIDATDLNAQVRSAQAQVQVARAAVAQAEAAYQQQIVTTRTGIQSAEAGLRSARARLSEVRAGSRRQEVAQAEAQVEVARANTRKAQQDYERYRNLLREGAVAEAVFDQYRNALEVARAEQRRTEQALSLAQEGARAQEIEQQTQAVRQAEETLRQARAGNAQNQVRRAAVLSARASLRQAQSGLSIAEQALRDAVVRSPIAGRVASRTADPGQVVSSGTKILSVVALRSVYFEPTVPDVEVGRIRRGQPVLVSVDAFPGRTFNGTVSRVYPSGSAESRAFPIRVTIANTSQALRPEMFARGDVITERRTGAVLVPREALVRTGSLAEGDQRVRVFTVEDDVAREHQVRPGLPSEDGRYVEAPGIPAAAQVIVSGQRVLQNGDRVTLIRSGEPERSAQAL